MILFINACVRKQSRTLKLARKLLDKLNEEIKEVILANTFYGIEDVHQIKAEGLDIIGADVDAILSNVSID